MSGIVIQFSGEVRAKRDLEVGGKRSATPLCIELKKEVIQSAVALRSAGAPK
jgi:hypothetical protein